MELTNDLYRLTILFPKEEPIRIKTRSLADDILTDMITILTGGSDEKVEAARNAQRKISILESMLEIAEDQKWIKEEEFEDVKKRYVSIRKELELFNKSAKKKKDPEEEPLRKERQSSGGKVTSLNARQKKILELLENSVKLQVQDVIDELDEEVTKRTVRRDFKKLMKLDFVERLGKANLTYYRIKQ